MALAALGITVVHPHDILTVGGILVVFVLVRAVTAVRGERRREARRGAAVLGALALGAAPLSTYHLSVLLADPSYWFYARHVHLIYTERWLVDFGLVLVAAAIGAGAILVRRDRDRALLVVWPATLAACLASPYPEVQRSHLYYGLHIVLCTLAVRGLWALGEGICRAHILRRTWAAHFSVAGLALFAAIGAITNVMKYVEELRPQRPREPNFLRAEEVEALQYLDTQARDDETVACLATVGADIPLWTGSRVYVGHPELTEAYAWRADQMSRLLGQARPGPDGRWAPPLTESAAVAILRAAQADFLYVDSTARRGGSEAAEDLLTQCGLVRCDFSNRWTAVYRIDRERLEAATHNAPGKPGG